MPAKDNISLEFCQVVSLYGHKNDIYALCLKYDQNLEDL